MNEIELEDTMVAVAEQDYDEALKKYLRYAMERDHETGEVKIYPMNGENHITIHGIEDARLFTSHLLDYFQTA